MNKKQLIIMWAGIALFSLILLFPESKREMVGQRIPVTRTKLCLIVPAVVAGLIVTYKNEKRKDKPKDEQKETKV